MRFTYFDSFSSHLGLITSTRSIHLVHDDAKEKDFELEMSWIGQESNFRIVPVPDDLFKEADQKARDALENFEGSD